MHYNNTCQDPFDFIHNLKKRYRKGLTLQSPDLVDRALSAEDLLNWDKVKILMIENLFKMPRDVRMQVVVDLCDAPKIGHNEAIRDELLCILQDMPDILNAPAANHNAHEQGYAQGFLQRYPRSFKQKIEDMKDPAFMTAESVL